MRRGVWQTGARLTAWALMLGLAVGTAQAGWADRLFHEQTHDFGPVPRGAKVRHSFVLTNSLTEPINVLDVRASCGCTTGRVSATLVPPGASATVEAVMDTRNFVGKKATTLYVTLLAATGRETEVRLGVSCTILSDIVLNPGTIDFGTTSRGQSPTQSLTIDRVGMPHWAVNRMVSSSRALDATLTETVRNGQNVGYELKVSLRPNAPAGTLRDQIQLMTNDRETPVVPILVTATIRGELSASPGVLSMGNTATSGVVQGRFLVRSARPFVVRAIEGEGDGFTAKVDNETPGPIHFVTVSYRPEDGKTRGDLRHSFRLSTDLDAEPPLELVVTLHVEP